jgi:hypothetical protein
VERKILVGKTRGEFRYLEKENDIIKIAKAILKKAKTKSPLLGLLQGEKSTPKKS